MDDDKWARLDSLGSTNVDDRRGEFTPSDLYEYIKRTPRLAAEYTPHRNWADQFLTDDERRIRAGQLWSEASAVADPFGVAELRRLLGMGVPLQFWLNESHGLANKERDRMLRGGGRR